LGELEAMGKKRFGLGWRKGSPVYELDGWMYIIWSRWVLVVYSTGDMVFGREE
jgi:hypothetical protein